MKGIREELAAVPAELRRALRIVPHGAEAMIEKEGRRLVNLATNNYLSLATHPEVIEAAVRALREDGAGAGSSRLILGTSPRVAALEDSLAGLKGTSRALIFPSGFAAALGAIPALVGKGDGIALEKGCHASLVTGARLSGASISVFRRGERSTLEKALERLRKRCRRILTVIDGIHSMDGDIAPLPEIIPLVARFESILLLDDAHATGVLGENGSGTLGHFRMSASENFIVQMGTLSKALGSQGGFIAASGPCIELMIQKSAAFIYTTGINPAAVGAAQGAIDVMKREPKRIARLARNAVMVRRAAGIEEIPSPIAPILTGTSERAMEASRELERAGAYAPAIRPPTVPRGTARLRLSLQADHRMHMEGAETTPELSFLTVLKEIAHRPRV